MVATPKELRALRTASPDFEGTKRLKQRIQLLYTARHPFFLAQPEIDDIFRWKLGSQYGRVRARLRANTDAAYRVATQACFSYHEPDAWGRELELRVRFLMAVPGVGLGIASAILALVEPNRYCVIDFRGWRSVFDETRTSFTVVHYIMYLERVKALAKMLSWEPQEVDLALWEYDRRRKGRAA